MIGKRIKILRKKFKKYNIDGYVVPKNDEFFSEYAIKDRLKIISDFNGSAGLAIILKNLLFLKFLVYVFLLLYFYLENKMVWFFFL